MTSLAGALGRVARATLGGTPVVQAGHPALRQVAAQVGVDELKSEPVQTLIKKMIKQVQHRTKGGYGLAASQLGVPKRIFVAQITQRDLVQLGPEERQELGIEEFPLKVFVNPTLRVTDKRMVATHEGCLSVDGYAAVVRRPYGVRVTALDEQGKQHITEAKGFLARVLQHEMDHLEGHLYIEKMDPATFTCTEHLKA